MRACVCACMCVCFLRTYSSVLEQRDRVIAESQDKVRLVNQLATERDGVPVECGSLAAEGHGQIQLAAANAIVVCDYYRYLEILCLLASREGGCQGDRVQEILK